MNHHETYQDLILQYDMLDEQQKRQVDEHIKTCKQCQQYFDLFIEMNEALDMIAIEEDINDEITSREETIQPLPKRRAFSRWTQLALAASLLGFRLPSHRRGKPLFKKQ